MAKANKYHSSGNSFRRNTSIKTPLKDRRHNKEKWKERQSIKKEIRTTREDSGWWKKKQEKEVK